MRAIPLLAAFIVAILASGGPASAQPADSSHLRRAIMTNIEKRIVRQYYEIKHKEAAESGAAAAPDAGTAGIAIERDAKLPAGTRTAALPQELEEVLPPAPDGTRRVIVGNDVVLLDKATGVVLDILPGALKVPAAATPAPVAAPAPVATPAPAPAPAPAAMPTPAPAAQ